MVKTKELIKYLEKLKKFEDKLRNNKGKPSYFLNYEEFINKIANEEDKKITPHISEKLKTEITNSFKSLNTLKSEIAKHEEILKDLNLEINDKQCIISTLNFEKELKGTMVKQKKKNYNKNFVFESQIEKKIPSPLINNSPIDEFLYCETFFRVLLNKPTERLVQKAKVSQDHIFKSLTVIYDRAIIQLNSYKITEISNFRQLLYRQFVKTDTRKKNEKNLKNFFAGCLKFANFRRISVFFRLLGMGE